MAKKTKGKARPKKRKADPVVTEIIRNGVIAVTEESHSLAHAEAARLGFERWPVRAVAGEDKNRIRNLRCGPEQVLVTFARIQPSDGEHARPPRIESDTVFSGACGWGECWQGDAIGHDANLGQRQPKVFVQACRHVA